MALAQNNQFTAIDFRYLKDDAMLGNNPRSNAFGTTGKLYAIFLDNTTGSASASAYLKLFDTAATVTSGTTVTLSFALQTLPHYTHGCSPKDSPSLTGLDITPLRAQARPTAAIWVR